MNLIDIFMAPSGTEADIYISELALYLESKFTHALLLDAEPITALVGKFVEAKDSFALCNTVHSAIAETFTQFGEAFALESSGDGVVEKYATLEHELELHVQLRNALQQRFTSVLHEATLSMPDPEALVEQVAEISNSSALVSAIAGKLTCVLKYSFIQHQMSLSSAVHGLAETFVGAEDNTLVLGVSTAIAHLVRYRTLGDLRNATIGTLAGVKMNDFIYIYT